MAAFSSAMSRDKINKRIKDMFRKKGTADKRQVMEGAYLSTLVHGEKTLMAQFSIARGSVIPSHSHPHEQTGFMVSGKLRFKVENETMDVESGDSWCIPGDIEHSADALEDSVIIEVFSPVREDYLP